MDTYEFDRANPLHRVMRSAAALKPVSWAFAHTLHHVDRAVYGATKGKKTLAAIVSGLPVCMLTTTGAKSGLPRTVPLVAIPDGADLIVIGSNYGRSSAPAWCANLRANPRATVAFEHRSLDVVAVELERAEADRQYARGVAIYPGWKAYEARANRPIPVFRLTPAS